MPFEGINLEDLRQCCSPAPGSPTHRGASRSTPAALLDALGAPAGRDNFWRFASMVQRRGGETFLEFRTPRSRGEPKFFGAHQRTYGDPDDVAREIESYGGRVDRTARPAATSRRWATRTP